MISNTCLSICDGNDGTLISSLVEIAQINALILQLLLVKVLVELFGYLEAIISKQQR